MAKDLLIRTALDARKVGGAHSGSPLMCPTNPQQAAVAAAAAGIAIPAGSGFEAAYSDYNFATNTYTENIYGTSVTIDGSHHFIIATAGHYLLNFYAEVGAGAQINVYAEITEIIYIDVTGHPGPSTLYHFPIQMAGVAMFAQNTLEDYFAAGTEIWADLSCVWWGGVCVFTDRKSWGRVVRLG